MHKFLIFSSQILQACPTSLVQIVRIPLFSWPPALCYSHKEICDNNIPARIVATVHDEVLVECDKRVGEKVRDMLSRIMLEAFRFVFNRVGIKGADANIVEAHIGGNWYDAK